MSSGKTLVVLAAVLCGAALISAATGQLAVEKQPCNVAAVDVSKVFDTCKEFAQIEADITAAGEDQQRKILEIQHEVLQFRNDLDLLKQGSEAWEQKKVQIQRKVIEKKVEEVAGKQRILFEQMTKYEQLYMKLRDACKEVAEANGYDLVLFAESALLQKPQNLAQLSNQIGGRKILYAADELNITEQVLQHMDNIWQNRHANLSQR